MTLSSHFMVIFTLTFRENTKVRYTFKIRNIPVLYRFMISTSERQIFLFAIISFQSV